MALTSTALHQLLAHLPFFPLFFPPIHAIKYAAEESRVAAVMAHLLLGPIMPYAYYFATRPGATEKRRAEST